MGLVVKVVRQRAHVSGSKAPECIAGLSLGGYGFAYTRNAVWGRSRSQTIKIPLNFTYINPIAAKSLFNKTLSVKAYQI